MAGNFQKKTSWSSFTLSEDIRHIKRHTGLLLNVPSKDIKTPKITKEEETFVLESLEKQRVYDALKNIVGSKRSYAIVQQEVLQIYDDYGNDVKLHTPFKKSNDRFLVRNLVVKCLSSDIKEDVRLMPDAYKKLKAVHESFQSKQQDASEKANQFYREYGTHFHAGELSLGGSFEWMITWTTETEDNKKEELAKRLLDKCRNLKGSKEGIWYSANKLVSLSEGIDACKMAGYKLRVSNSGGTLAESSLDVWLDSLESEMHLIKSGHILPIWHLVTNSTYSFTEATQFAEFLKRTWENDVLRRPLDTRDRLLEILGLVMYQDKGISLDTIRSFTLSHSDMYKKEPGDIPWMMIEQLMRMDHRCRSNNVINAILHNHKKNIPQDITFHPMDTMLMVFMSCDLILRQMLVQKMAMTRLAIPFLIPSSTGTMLLSLWPLRGVSVQWIKPEGRTFDVSLVKHPFKIISFLRFGRINTSKSIVLNNVIMAPKSGTFYHREASGGKKKRTVSNGMVEMSCYLPKYGTGKFSQELMFLNLRGDGNEYSHQSDTVCSLSSVIVCFVDISGVNEFKLKLEEIMKTCSKVVVLLTKEGDDPLEDEDEENIETLEKKGIHVIQAFEPEGFMNNAADIADATVDVLSGVITDTAHKMSPIETLVSELKRKGIEVDEDNDTTIAGCKKDVDVILTDFEGTELEAAKKKFLPLQGAILKEWANCLKEKHKGLRELTSEQAIQRNDSITKKMQKCRKAQIKLANPLQNIMRRFIDLQETKTSDLEQKAFHKMLSILVDNISRGVISQLRQNYLYAWQNRVKDAAKFIEAARILDNSSFGVENLFREMGQIYECLKEYEGTLSSDMHHIMRKLPSLAAQFFESGHPFEIMDGDAGLVPYRWVSAVLDALHLIIGDKKMFMLSVVGVQSSGKSTLLNTMFGLELAVGAGRCTRGMFAQLLPVDRAKSNLPVDYILVLDSEGLCSTSLKGNQENDYEIASLAIGLADLALVNIKGENTEQMKEVFDIVVHAFLRMKFATTYKKQKCLFLHQSVSAADAKDLLLKDRLSLQDHLDRVTKSAAEHENVSGKISKFADIINFDSERDVFYIPDLWSGTPPLAQVSSGYSEGIRKVRDVILQEIRYSISCITALDLKIRLQDMSNGILAEDFLFSFKNNLSVKAYLALESKFHGLIRETESHLLECMNTIVRIEIERYEDADYLDRYSLRIKGELKTLQEQCLNDKLKMLLNFFDESDLTEHLSPWKSVKSQALESRIDELFQHTLHDVQYHIDCKKIELEKMTGKSKIIQSIQNLAEEVKGKPYDEKELNRKFTKVLNDWETSNNIMHEMKRYDVGKEIDGILHAFAQERALPSYPDPSEWTEYEDRMGFGNVKDDYVAFCHDAALSGSTSGSGSFAKSEVFKRVMDITNSILEVVDNKIDNMMTSNLKFHSHLARTTLDLVANEIKQHQALLARETSHQLTPHYEAMLLLHAGEIAKKKFKLLDKRYHQTLSIRVKLETFDNELRKLFHSMVQERVLEGATEFLHDKILENVVFNIHHDITRRSVDRILEKKKYKKKTLVVDVLTDLAERNSFPEHLKFVNDAYQYCSTWLIKDAQKMLFDKRSGQLKSEYAVFVEDYLRQMMDYIRKGISQSINKGKAQQNDTAMKVFVLSLKEDIQNIVPLTESDCQLIQSQNIQDFNQFQRLLADAVKKIEEEVTSRMTPATAETVEWIGETPYKRAMDRLWGCNAKCPLCSTPCVYTERNHIQDGKKHECLEHWPIGLVGTKWEDSKKLMTDICNFTITTGSTFNCAASKFKCRDSRKCRSQLMSEPKECSPTIGNDDHHPLKDYKDYLLEWEIEADSQGEATKYWQWVMCNHQQELADHFNADPPDPPMQWNRNKQDAINSLFRHGEETTEHDLVRTISYD